MKVDVFGHKQRYERWKEAVQKEGELQGLDAVLVPLIWSLVLGLDFDDN